jgi:COMPASS component SWD3
MCKKTYQGHVNKKYSLGGAFGVGGTEGFIVSGSEDGDIVFWDVRTKDVVQKVSGHEGVVCWVDTCPGASGTVVSGGLDGTVRIWVDVNEDEDGMDKLKDEQESGDAGHVREDGIDEHMIENGAIHGSPREASIDRETGHEREPSPERMDED